MESPSSPTDFEDSRKRVCKACDRCRIKKSKVCDGKKPCSRCRNDDAICVFGGRKKKTDRVHPKGYVEILERQQRQLVKGIRALFDLQLDGRGWNGPLPHKGYPPTHEILEHLGALDVDDSSEDEDMDDSSHFEENVHHLRQSVLYKAGDHGNAPPSSKGLTFAEQHALLPNQRPGDYFGKTRLGDGSGRSSAPSLSPDLANSGPSPSTSIESHQWSAAEWPEEMLAQQHRLTDGFALSRTDLIHHSEGSWDHSPMQDGFTDPYLVPAWQPDKDLIRDYIS